MAGMKRRAKAKGQTLAVRKKERKLRKFLRMQYPDHNCDDLMDRIRPQVLAAARNGLSGAEAAAARADSAEAFAALAEAIREAVQEG